MSSERAAGSGIRNHGSWVMGQSTNPVPRSPTPEGRVAVIGRRDAVAAFRAAGLSVFPTEPGPDAPRRVEELVKAGYRVIFFTAELFDSLGPLLDRYRKAAVPCVVALPEGEAGASVARLRAVVRQAVGADVFGK